MTSLAQSVESASPPPSARWGQLDHVRAFAAYLVFAWHFMHGTTGHPVPFEVTPILPFAALIDEGHVGVALFMCLSGYIFAKLLEGKKIKYRYFILARLVRLFPLLLFVFSVNLLSVIWRNESVSNYLTTIAKGFIFPVWPNGGWSIAVELHFYLLLPFVLTMRRRAAWAIPTFIVIAILARTIIFEFWGTAQDAGYWTIFGRIDQFLLGIWAYDHRIKIQGKHLLATLVISAFALYYYMFDRAGGMYRLNNTYPSSSPLWILMPTIEGACCSIAIAWYGESFAFRGKLAYILERVGFYSYGIYLLHFYFVMRLANFIDKRVMSLDNFYISLAWSIPAFLTIIFPAMIAYNLIERPIQRFKPVYY